MYWRRLSGTKSYCVRLVVSCLRITLEIYGWLIRHRRKLANAHKKFICPKCWHLVSKEHHDVPIEHRTCESRCFCLGGASVNGSKNIIIPHLRNGLCTKSPKGLKKAQYSHVCQLLAAKPQGELCAVRLAFSPYWQFLVFRVDHEKPHHGEKWRRSRPQVIDDIDITWPILKRQQQL